MVWPRSKLLIFPEKLISILAGQLHHVENVKHLIDAKLSEIQYEIIISKLTSPSELFT